MSKNIYRPRRSALAWFCLLVVLVGTLVLLASCGSNDAPSTGSAPPATTIANTPTTGASSTTPTPTPTTSTSSTTPIPTPAPGTSQTVMIITNSDGSFIFSPATLTIKAGTTVTWKNMSSAPHTITSDDGKTFDSGTIPTGGTFRFTFKTTGAFPYHCNYHPYMRATINLA
jgi:plastocyanin